MMSLEALVRMEAKDRMLAIALNAVVVLMPTSSPALTGNELLRACKSIASDAGMHGKARCIGYLDGLIEGWDAGLAMYADAANPDQRYDFCIPERATREHIVQVVTEHLESAPEELHQSASIMALASLIQSFPCTTKP